MALTTRTDVLRPSVNAGNVMLALVKELNLVPFADVFTTLVGRPGDEVTLPEYDFIGESSTPSTMDDGQFITMHALSHSTQKTIIKKTTVGIAFSDEAIISGDRDIEEIIQQQLATAIAVTVEKSVIQALNATPNAYPAGTALTFASLVNTNATFPNQLSSQKVLFIHPDQYPAFANQPRSIFANEYEAKWKGEIGALAGVHIIPSENVVKAGTLYQNNMVCLPVSENDSKAVSIFLKRDLNIEVARVVKNRSYEISADIIFAVALTNPDKAILVRHL
ncbi:MAG: hypothetical protein FWF59_12000 [Turicibacter sp.]|nr:hypothetical protein [Turicibacter sp.]